MEGLKYEAVNCAIKMQPLFNVLHALPYECEKGIELQLHRAVMGAI